MIHERASSILPCLISSISNQIHTSCIWITALQNFPRHTAGQKLHCIGSSACVACSSKSIPLPISFWVILLVRWSYAAVQSLIMSPISNYHVVRGKIPMREVDPIQMLLLSIYIFMKISKCASRHLINERAQEFAQSTYAICSVSR